MSRAYNRRKKVKRMAADAANPERKRVRRMIRSGSLPRRAFAKAKGGGIIKRIARMDTKAMRRWIYLNPWATYDVFRSLTQVRA